MKRSNITVVQDCLKQLPNEVNVGMCMDTTNNTVYSFISFPKDRFSEELIIKRIDILNKYHTKVLNAITGYFYLEERCYLIQEQQNAVGFISDFWSNIKNNLEMDVMVLYKDCAMQFIYALAYILKYLNEINIGPPLTGYQLATFHDQFEPCFTGLGFPEIFGESKNSANNEQYFIDFLSEINPFINENPSIDDIVNGKFEVPGSSEKRSQIIKLCAVEQKQTNSSEEKEEKEDDKIEDEEINSPYKKHNISIIQECIRQLSDEVNIGLCLDAASSTSFSFISFPKKRFDEKSIIERIELLNKYHTQVLNAVIGYFYSDERCYLIQEQQNVFAFISDFWENMKTCLEIEGMEMYKDCAMQFIYILAYILNYFNSINLGPPLTGYQLASYHDQYEPCFTGLGFPEIFGDKKTSEINEQYLADFIKEINPNIQEIPSIEDIVSGKVNIPGSSAKRSEFLKLCSNEAAQENDENSNEQSEKDENASEKENEDNKLDENDVKNEEKYKDDEIKAKEKNNNVSTYKKDNIKIVQECMKALPKNVQVGMCMDSNNKTYSFISFPKKRFSEASIQKRIEKLSKFNVTVLNTVIGYTIIKNRCYLLQEQNNAVAFISDFWDDLSDKLNMEGMETYQDIAMQFMYSLAYILNFFNEIDLVPPLTGYELASYHDQYEPCFTGLGFPEIFGETKTSENNEQYFTDFCKKMNSRMKKVPTIEKVVNGKAKINGSLSKKAEIIFILTGKQYEETNEDDEDSDPTIKYENENMMIADDVLKEFPNDVNFLFATDITNNSQYLVLSCPEDRISREVICERIEQLNKYKTPVLNSVIGFFYADGRCYLIEERSDTLTFLSDFWSDVVDNINKGSNENRSIGMQFIYSLAFILKHFNEIDLGAALNGYDLASYVNSYEPCFTGLGFPEIFGEKRDSSTNEQYFADFIRQINPQMENVPTINDVVNGTAKIRGSIVKRAEILYILTGDEKYKEKPKEEEEEEEDVNEDENKKREEKYSFIDCNESILTEPCFNEPFYSDEVSHMYEISTLFERNFYINGGSLNFIRDESNDRFNGVINSLGSEFEAGNIANQKCISHKTPNDPISISNEKLVIMNVNDISIPYCMHHQDNQFVYMMMDDATPLTEEYDLSSSKTHYIAMFMSFLYNLHQNGFLYLRSDFKNIFKCKYGIYICGFDTCMKIGSKECSSEMKDWDDKPTELTDCICLAAFIYFVYTKKNLFNDDPQSNKEKFKKGIRIPSKIFGLKKARMLRSLLSPDPNVRKSVQWADFLNDFDVDEGTVELPFFGSYYLREREYSGNTNNISFETSKKELFVMGSIPHINCNVCPNGPSIEVQIGDLYSATIGCCYEHVTFNSDGAKRCSFVMNAAAISMTLIHKNDETYLQWDNENGIIIKFPEFAVKMNLDGSLLFPDGKFRKKIENGNLIIEGEGLKLTHGGSFLSLESDVFSFTKINDECWEIKSPIVHAKYSNDEIFMKTADFWLKYADYKIEWGFRGYHYVFTDNVFQVKYSFMEIAREINKKCRFRFFNKELIPKELKNEPFRMKFYEIPEVEMPKVPMQSGNTKKDKDDEIPPSFEDRAIDKKDDSYRIDRDCFDQLYDKMKNENPKINIQVPDPSETQQEQKKPKKEKKKKEKKKPKQKQESPQNQDENQIENMQLPLMENNSNENRISQEELPNDFGATQAINKINKLLEAGESISFYTSAKIVNFLKPKRIRKIVITSSGRVFFTNIGGDGILGTIEINDKSHADRDGSHVKVHGSNKTFHFVFENNEDGQKFVEKFLQCIN